MTFDCEENLVNSSIAKLEEGHEDNDLPSQEDLLRKKSD